MNNLASLLWLVVVLAAIPVLLWLLKRTPLLRGMHRPGAPRTVASLPLSANQRVVTVEVGLGEERQWLVLGVSPQGITTLHTMPAGSEAANSDLPALTLPAPSAKTLAVPTARAASSASSASSASTKASPRSGSGSLHAAAPAKSGGPLASGAQASSSRAAPGTVRPSGASATFSQLIQRLRTPASSSLKRSQGKPPRDSKPGNHER